MEWLILAAVIAVAAYFALSFVSKGVPKREDEKHYNKIGALMTPAERSFFGVLKLSVKESRLIFSKVRVADVLETRKGLDPKTRQSAFNKISAKHFDFLLCDPMDLSILCAVELDDKSHGSKKRQKRDAFLEAACESADLPLIRVPAKAAYSTTDIEQLLGDFFVEMEKAAEADVASGDVSSSEQCPKCQSELVIRKAKKGKHAGKSFKACSAYPRCRFIQSTD